MAGRYYTKRDRHFGKYTMGRQWMDFKSKEYIGPYHFFGNYERVMTGAWPRDDSKPLQKFKDINLHGDVMVYDVITSINLYEFEPPIPKRPGPGPNDIKNGYMMRYFIKQKNDITKPPIEIDLKQYDNVKEDDSKNINGFLYEKISLRWKIDGPRKDQYHDKGRMQIKAYGIEDTNRRTALQKSLVMAGISDHLRNLVEHSGFDRIEKAAKLSQQTDNLQTDGSEFVLANGTPFIGYYHIHPTMGAMRGKKHSDKVPHDQLMTSGEYAIWKARNRGERHNIDKLEKNSKWTNYTK
tara:strand:- start:2931 stop:3815 length:885 start_codon:yes stop_codon:yes gene_type:complete